MDIATEGPTEKKTCIMVNEEDVSLGIGALAECHVRPMTLHRAFSLFVFDENGAMLLQQRAKSKYTFPLAWTNTVCSHPRNLDKSMEEWIGLRVQDELGWEIDNLAERLQVVGKLTYWAYSDKKYGEKEVDTLYYVQVSEEEKSGLAINPDEVEAITWASPTELQRILRDDCTLVTPWCRAIVEGFGFPFHEKILQGGSLVEAAQEKPPSPTPEQDEQEAEQRGRRLPTSAIHSFVESSTGATLPWFRVGNCSKPLASPASDLLLQAPFSYLCSNPGKNIRSELVKLYADVDNKVSSEDVNGLCWIVERIHAASLLHDDIEDQSRTRRGAVCSHLLWGVAQTINTGTFNFLRAVQGVDEQLAHRDASTRNALMRLVLETELALHRGQNADICWGEHSLVPTASEYLQMIDMKTGALFKACALLGAACSGESALGAEMARVMLDLGRYFQVRDDLCNVCDPAYWRAKGFFEDADEGKMSYPVLVFLDSETAGDGEEAQWLRTRFSARDSALSVEEKLRAYRVLYASGALAATRDYCQDKLAALRESKLVKSPRGAKVLDLLYLVDVLSPAQVEQMLV